MKFFKLLFFVGFLSLKTLNASCQNNIYGGITFEQLTFKKSSVYSIGADVYAPFLDRFTLNYSLKLGYSKDYNIAFHSSISTLVGTYLLALNADYPGIAALGIICLAIPEGVGMYLGPEGHAMHLSINPLGMDYFGSLDQSLDYTGMSCSAVARVHYKMKSHIPSYITPMVGIYYRDNQTNFGEKFGIRFGVSFGVASKKVNVRSSLKELLYE